MGCWAIMQCFGIQTDLLFDLSAFLPNAESSYAYAINDNGWVVGYADVSNMRLAVIWEPVPEPSAFVALACGLVWILTRTRKRRSL